MIALNELSETQVEVVAHCDVCTNRLSLGKYKTPLTWREQLLAAGWFTSISKSRHACDECKRESTAQGGGVFVFPGVGEARKWRTRGPAR